MYCNRFSSKVEQTSHVTEYLISNSRDSIDFIADLHMYKNIASMRVMVWAFEFLFGKKKKTYMYLSCKKFTSC